MAGQDGAFNERILEGLRPNFFELLSQEAMHEALRPAIRYIIKVPPSTKQIYFQHTSCVYICVFVCCTLQTLAQSRPDWFAAAWNFSDEIYLLLESFLQLHFIRSHSKERVIGGVVSQGGGVALQGGGGCSAIVSRLVSHRN